MRVSWGVVGRNDTSFPLQLPQPPFLVPPYLICKQLTLRPLFPVPLFPTPRLHLGRRDLGRDVGDGGEEFAVRASFGPRDFPFRQPVLLPVAPKAHEITCHLRSCDDWNRKFG